ncbi:sugar transporter ERD6-like 4, partial [Penaeus japonicus]|uniref:sugar transporter ERD6-like 4 n=1 Tax=Penaeus japonicus TaxID=27405 RepID=UPI001C713BEE
VIFGFIVEAAKLDIGFGIGWTKVLSKIMNTNVNWLGHSAGVRQPAFLPSFWTETRNFFINTTELGPACDSVSSPGVEMVINLVAMHVTCHSPFHATKSNKVSLPGTEGIVVTLAIGPTMEALGPRKYLLILLLPAGIPWLVQAFTPYLSLFYLGRVVSCLISAALGPVAAVLTAELSEPRIRGLLLSIEEITVALGQMAIYVMAHALPWDVATAVCAAPVISVALLTFFVPESPYWLIRRDRKEAAMESLKKLRSPTENVGLELQEITASIQGTCQITIKDQVEMSRHL